MKDNFVINLKKYRTIKHISQKLLAKKSNLSQQYVSLLESPDRQESPTLHTVCNVTKSLNICPYSILKYDCKNNCNNYPSCTLHKLLNIWFENGQGT